MANEMPLNILRELQTNPQNQITQNSYRNRTIKENINFIIMRHQLKRKKEKTIGLPEELSRWFLGRNFHQSIGDLRRRVGESWKRVWFWTPLRPGLYRVWCRISPLPAGPGASLTGTPRRRQPPQVAVKSLVGEFWIIGPSENKWARLVTGGVFKWLSPTQNKMQQKEK